MQISNKEKNWLIIGGGLSLSTSLLLIVFFDFEPSYIKSRFESTDTLFIRFFLVPIVIAPVFEEILFRGFLSKSKPVRIVFFLTGLITLFLFEFKLIIISLAILTYLLYLAFLYRGNSFFLDFVILLSAVVFASMHYSPEGIFSPQDFPFFLVQFGAALMFSWLIHNGSIFIGMLGHAIWNLIGTLVVLLGLQFVNQEIAKADYGESTIIYNRVPIFSSNISSYKREDQELTAKNMSLVDIINLLDKRYLDTFNIVSPFMRYDIQISSKDTVSKTEFDHRTIQLMEGEDLIFRGDSQ